MTTDPLAGLQEAVAAVRDAWREASSGDDLVSPRALSSHALVAVNEAITRLGRVLAGVHAPVAAEIADRSRPELGAESLAKQQGFRSPVALIAATAGTSNGDAARLVAVGNATTPRSTFSGVDAPPRHPHVADAVRAGCLGTAAAAQIVAMLDRVAVRATREALADAELSLVRSADGLSLDQLVRLLARAEAHLAPETLEVREQELRAKRQLMMFERDGMLHLTGQLDPEAGAPVKIAIQAIVSAEMRAARDAGLRDGDETADRRTVGQMQADALTTLARHMAGCELSDVPLEGATVIVRMTLDQLTADDERSSETESAVAGTESRRGSASGPAVGFATIDGVGQPISVGTARRMAAGGKVIPCVLGGESEILDWGRAKRLFTRAQKLALAERDGGCAMCGAPPGLTRVHHIDWWSRDAGPTDLSNGVLLCESCHHRIHDNGWDIRIDGPSTTEPVWFIPPVHVDPERVPRAGGRARFDYAA